MADDNSNDWKAINSELYYNSKTGHYMRYDRTINDWVFLDESKSMSIPMGIFSNPISSQIISQQISIIQQNGNNGNIDGGTW